MRSYSSHNYRPSWGNFTTNSVVGKIILANVVVFVIQSMFIRDIGFRNDYFGLVGLLPRDAITKLYVWQPFTYMWVHSGFMHLFFNMLMTWFIGNTLESVWGGRGFLTYYIACGLGGAACSFIFGFNTIVIGASAAVFGLYLAYAMLFPNNLIYVYFLFPVRAKYLVTFLAVMQLIQGISGGGGIAYFAHLGGVAAGLLFFRRQIMSSNLFFRSRRRWASHARSRKEGQEPQEGVKIDSILDKIASKGYENLTTTEKRILENYSRKHKEDAE